MEQIIEEVTEMRFEKMAEIKFMYKNCDSDKANERDVELDGVKKEMEAIKLNKVSLAKEKMQAEKKLL